MNSSNENEAINPTLNKGGVMPSCLFLPLKTKWFEMTKSDIKTEDYRDITPYWCKRFILSHGNKLSEEFTELEIEVLCDELNNTINCMGDLDEEVCFVLDNYYATLKQFSTNIMTLGYPKATDSERILKLEHKGIEIRTGNPMWGAVPNKLYFVVKHGAILA
jgi:hypothetical protein